MAEKLGVESEKPFVCGRCGHRLPVACRHPEAPEYCVLDYVSPSDAAFIARVVEEVMAEP